MLQPFWKRFRLIRSSIQVLPWVWSVWLPACHYRRSPGTSTATRSRTTIAIESVTTLRPAVCSYPTLTSPALGWITEVTCYDSLIYEQLCSSRFLTQESVFVANFNLKFLSELSSSRSIGKYECLALNEIGQVNHQGHLNVYGPAIVRPMPNRTVVGGERLVLNCPVGGHPINQIYWEKGKPLKILS